MTLDHSLERTLTILAKRETVFRFFTDNSRWEKWWGKGSTVEPREGGRIRILYPNAVEVIGEVLEIAAPRRIAFTYGFTSGSPIPPGASRVTIDLEEEGSATRLHGMSTFRAGVTSLLCSATSSVTKSMQTLLTRSMRGSMCGQILVPLHARSY